MAKDPIKKANNGTYYFRANLGYDAVTGKQIQKYRSGFSTKKEARAEYSKLILAAEEGLAMEKKQPSFKQFIEEIYLPWYKTQVKESTYKNRLNTIEKHFKFFYRKKVNEIEPIHVQTWQLNPLIVKDRLGHEKIQTTLGTYGHLYPNSNFEVAKMLGGIINFTPATESIADYTHNQFTASYHRQI